MVTRLPPGQWLPINDAAIAMDTTAAALRKKVQRGTIHSRKAKDGIHLEILVPSEEQDNGTLDITSDPGSSLVTMGEMSERILTYNQGILAPYLQENERLRVENKALHDQKDALERKLGKLQGQLAEKNALIRSYAAVIQHQQTLALEPTEPENPD